MDGDSDVFPRTLSRKRHISGFDMEREEYIEQEYFFNALRQRLSESVPMQEILGRLDEEILSTTRLPMAIQFLATELKHTGLLSSGFQKLPHYFTPFQAFVLKQTEQDRNRFSVEMGLLILEREAHYRAREPSRPGLFVYLFEAISRNRLGYDEGLDAIRNDGFFDGPWREFAELVKRQLGAIEFAHLVYLRSAFYVVDQRRTQPDYEPPVPVLFGEKEGKIARANRGRDPLYLFAALQRQLGYPDVPRPKPRDDVKSQLEAMKVKSRELEARVKLLEGEVRGKIDLTEFLAKPQDFAGDD